MESPIKSNESLVECSAVIVKETETETKGLGAFAKNDIKKDDLIEKGVCRTICIDGNNNPYLFTWSEDRSMWAFGSGCSTFYNTSLEPNTKMIRNFDNDSFEIYALRDIQKDEELTHKYRSLEWRECFQDLNKNLKLNK